jgi:hypothetical protein
MAGDGFARAGFTDDSHGFALLEGKAHAVNGTVDSVAGMKMRSEIVDCEERHCEGGLRLPESGPFAVMGEKGSGDELGEHFNHCGEHSVR